MTYSLKMECDELPTWTMGTLSITKYNVLTLFIPRTAFDMLEETRRCTVVRITCRREEDSNAWYTSLNAVMFHYSPTNEAEI